MGTAPETIGASRVRARSSAGRAGRARPGVTGAEGSLGRRHVIAARMADLDALNDPDEEPDRKTAGAEVQAVLQADPATEDALYRRHQPAGSGPAHGRTAAHVGCPSVITLWKVFICRSPT